MVKANIETGTGTKIIIEGSADEVASIISRIKGTQLAHEEKDRLVKAKNQKTGAQLTDILMQMRDDGFFDKPKKVIDVKQGLDQKAHIYPFPSISTALIRWVKKGQLGRVKIDGTWGYVKR